MRIVLLVAALALTGCNATMQQARRGPADDPTRHCFDRMDSDQRLAVLAPKVGSVSRGGRATVEMLASTAKADEEDKKAISAWGQARQSCVAEGRAFRAQNAPPGWVPAFEAGQTEFLGLMARLYAGELTYGEFNRQRLDLGAKNDAALLNAADRAAAAAQQEQLNQQASTLQTMQIMQMLQPQPVIAPPMLRPPVNCVSRRVGSQVYTDCN
jgi:hypothetical protein